MRNTKANTLIVLLRTFIWSALTAAIVFLCGHGLCIANDDQSTASEFFEHFSYDERTQTWTLSLRPDSSKAKGWKFRSAVFTRGSHGDEADAQQADAEQLSRKKSGSLRHIWLTSPEGEQQIFTATGPESFHFRCVGSHPTAGIADGVILYLRDKNCWLSKAQFSPDGRLQEISRLLDRNVEAVVCTPDSSRYYYCRLKPGTRELVEYNVADDDYTVRQVLPKSEDGIILVPDGNSFRLKVDTARRQK